MTRRPLAAYALAASLCSATALPAQQAGTLRGAIEGLGQRSCADFVTAKDSNPQQYQAFALWLSGFMSAANGFQPNTFDLTPWQPLEMSVAQVLRYCQANADQTFGQASVAYLRFLVPDRIQEPERLVSVRNGNSGVFIYPQILARVKDRLQAEGLLAEGHDGDFDAAFIGALKTYQSQQGLVESGLPDTKTLIKLLR